MTFGKKWVVEDGRFFRGLSSEGSIFEEFEEFEVLESLNFMEDSLKTLYEELRVLREYHDSVVDLIELTGSGVEESSGVLREGNVIRGVNWGKKPRGE